LLNANFNRRRSIYRISPDNVAMVECARAQGASAKFTGSGGAIVGTYDGPKMFQQLKKALGKLGVKVIKPKITEPMTSLAGLA
jgi:glucuronokinase